MNTNIRHGKEPVKGKTRVPERLREFDKNILYSIKLPYETNQFTVGFAGNPGCVVRFTAAANRASHHGTNYPASGSAGSGHCRGGF